MTERDTILIVDDAQVNRVVLRNMFEKDFSILEAENGEQALEMLSDGTRPVSVVLLDLLMPVKDGYAVMEEMRDMEIMPRVPVIVITSDDSADSRIKIFKLGASDIIVKPFEPNVVRSRVKNIIELSRYRRHLEELVLEQSTSLRESNTAVIDMLSSVIEYRSLESGQHIRRIRLFTKILLEEVAKNYQVYNLDKRKIEIIASASSMHDIGKIAIPDSILNKPGRLTPEEFEIMKTHSLRGSEILLELGRMPDKAYMQYAYNICRYHHERWDGTGYPDGLKGENIPICAQVAAVADCFDALTTDRVYKDAIAPEEAFNMIVGGACGSFSPRILRCFKNVYEKFAALSKKYADGLQSDFAPKDILFESSNRMIDNLFEQGEMQYLTLLRYMDATVMEVDLSTGRYDLVFLAEPDFEVLRSGERYEDSIRNFADTMVHPDDRETVLSLPGQYMEDFFSQGFLRRSRTYRVRNRSTGKYLWYKASLLRMNTENPRQRKVMFVWHQIQQNETDLQVGSSKVLNQLLSGIQKCANDQHFTLQGINSFFTSLVGYTEAEIAEKFQNRYTNMIHPDDRQTLFTEINDNLKTGKMGKVIYRLLNKKGDILWISDWYMLIEEDGKEYLYCMLLDISESKRAEEQLRLSEEKYEILLRQTNDIVFEWDMINDTAMISSNWEKKFGYRLDLSQIKSQFLKPTHICAEDAPALGEAINEITVGVPYKEIEIRIIDSAGRYHKCSIRMTAQFDEQKNPLRVIGTIVDSDEAVSANDVSK